MQSEIEIGVYARSKTMIGIKKGTEPQDLTRLRQSTEAEGLSPREAYRRLRNPLKEQVRQSLIQEQRGLCAYCMCRIPREDVDPNIAPIIIEHIIPRVPVDGRDVGQGLDYNNLLAVCHGNKASYGEHQFIDLTCDAHRGNTEFRKINPCIPETLSSIVYSVDGKIDAIDPDVRFDLVDTLNLNCPSSPLIAERKSALDSLIDELGNVTEENILDYCIMILSEFRAETEQKTPYVGILIWYLESLITTLSST